MKFFLSNCEVISEVAKHYCVVKCHCQLLPMIAFIPTYASIFHPRSLTHSITQYQRFMKFSIHQLEIKWHFELFFNHAFFFSPITNSLYSSIFDKLMDINIDIDHCCFIDRAHWLDKKLFLLHLLVTVIATNHVRQEGLCINTSLVYCLIFMCFFFSCSLLNRPQVHAFWMTVKIRICCG